MDKQKIEPVGLLIILTMIGIIVTQELPQYITHFFIIAAVILTAAITRNLIRSKGREIENHKTPGKEEK